MKSTLTGRITSIIDKNDGTHALTIESRGKVQTTNIASQETKLDGTLVIKSLVAHPLKIGTIFTITITDEPAVE